MATAHSHPGPAADASTAAEPADGPDLAPRLRLAPPWVLASFAVLIAVGAGLVGWFAAPSLPADGSAEAGFARDMRRHHDQAVEMSLIARDLTTNDEIRTLATDILLTQQNQNGQMLGWLSAWDLPPTGGEPSMAWMGHPADQPMPGLATPAEIAHLKELSGPAADAEFLRLMIRHHQGGTPMAEAILERTDREEVRRLARSIVDSQRTEVAYMESLLEKMTAA